jgi:hypothetical protein
MDALDVLVGEEWLASHGSLRGFPIGNLKLL